MENIKKVWLQFNFIRRIAGQRRWLLLKLLSSRLNRKSTHVELSVWMVSCVTAFSLLLIDYSCFSHIASCCGLIKYSSIFWVCLTNGKRSIVHFVRFPILMHENEFPVFLASAAVSPCRINRNVHNMWNKINIPLSLLCGGWCFPSRRLCGVATETRNHSTENYCVMNIK